mgnify:CR=1 FL=1
MLKIENLVKRAVSFNPERGDTVEVVNIPFEVSEWSKGEAAAAPAGEANRELLRGILNGVDTAVWNPASDPALAVPYAANRLAAKRENKRALQQEMGLDVVADRPLFGVISRLTHQKGLDLVLTLGEGITHLPAQLALLGSGDKAMEAGFSALAARHPGQISVRLGFDEALAHRIEAGADCFLMPSRFEPCGLNQMYSLRYGTPPVVFRTGGLADTVVDATEESLAAGTATGFTFDEPTAEARELDLDRVALHAVAAVHGPGEHDVLPVRHAPRGERQAPAHLLLVARVDVVRVADVDGDDLCRAWQRQRRRHLHGSFGGRRVHDPDRDGPGLHRAGHRPLHPGRLREHHLRRRERHGRRPGRRLAHAPASTGRRYR